MTTEFFKSKLKCRKCKSNNILIIELWKNHEITWEQINGEFDRNDGNLEPGYPYSIEAKCQNCKNHWKVRGASQIGDIII